MVSDALSHYGFTVPSKPTTPMLSTEFGDDYFAQLGAMHLIGTLMNQGALSKFLDQQEELDRLNKIECINAEIWVTPNTRLRNELRRAFEQTFEVSFTRFAHEGFYQWETELNGVRVVLIVNESIDHTGTQVTDQPLSVVQPRIDIL